MTLEEKLDIVETLFVRAIKRKDKSSAYFFKNIYEDIVSSYQDYIWYKGINTNESYINEVYNDYSRNRRGTRKRV